MALDYNTLAERIRAAGPNIVSGGGYNVDATGGESGGPSYYVEPYSYDAGPTYFADDKSYTFGPNGEIIESYTKEPKRSFNEEAQASGYYTNVYNPDGTVTRQFNPQKGTWELVKPLALTALGFAAAGGLPSLLGGAAPAPAAAAGGGFGITPEVLASIYGTEAVAPMASNAAIEATLAQNAITAGLVDTGAIGTSMAGLPAGASVIGNTVIDAAGNTIGTLSEGFGSTVAGTGASTAGSSLLGSAASAAGKTLADKLTDPKFLASIGIGAAAAAATRKENKKKLGPVGYQGKIDPNRLKYDPKTGEYTVRATGEKYAAGGIANLKPHEYKAGGRYLSGPGDGMSDNIKANIEGRQEARLADGEFVIPADVVSHLGNGSSNAGAKKLHSMMARIRQARTGNPKQGKQIKPEKYLPA